MDLLLSFYGDDFSGSTALGESLTICGIATIIFTVPKEKKFIENHFPSVKVVGVAGTSRSMRIEEMNKYLPPIFKTMKSYEAPLHVYKVCSTFDSSKSIGSIGRAIEIGAEIFSADIVPLIPAAPFFKRFTVFGNHFAALEDGEIYRLDRHPSMINHPVTPMHEADLRLILSEQTSLKIYLISILEVKKGKNHMQKKIEKLGKAAPRIILFDCLSKYDLGIICESIWESSKSKPVFVVGSQDLGYGFGKIWIKKGLINSEKLIKKFKSSVKKPILIVSGSCSTVTEKQINWAVKGSFIEVKVCPDRILDPSEREYEKERIMEETVKSLKKGLSVIIDTAKGPDDQRIKDLEKKIRETSLTYEKTNELIGSTLGEITLQIIEKTGLKRLVVCGGDTSGRVQRYLGVQALQISKSIGIAAPLCYVYSKIDFVNGLEASFKGGQAGSMDYFGKVLSARTSNFEDVALGQI